MRFWREEQSTYGHARSAMTLLPRTRTDMSWHLLKKCRQLSLVLTYLDALLLPVHFVILSSVKIAEEFVCPDWIFPSHETRSAALAVVVVVATSEAKCFSGLKVFWPFRFLCATSVKHSRLLCQACCLVWYGRRQTWDDALIWVLFITATAATLPLNCRFRQNKSNLTDTIRNLKFQSPA